MSADLRLYIHEQLVDLRRHVDLHRDLVASSAQSTPSFVEREAIALALHGFYGGIESVMRTVAELQGLQLDRSGSWHKDLLASMQRPSTDARPLLGAPLADRLGEFLTFRHVVRNLYGFELDWNRMAPLFARMDATLHQFEQAVHEFMDRLPPAP